MLEIKNQDAVQCYVTTETGSLYEISGSQIRRLYGEHEPTVRQGQDGAWKDFVSISEIRIGHSMLIVWGTNEGVHKSTMTTAVVNIQSVHK